MCGSRGRNASKYCLQCSTVVASHLYGCGGPGVSGMYIGGYGCERFALSEERSLELHYQR